MKLKTKVVRKCGSKNKEYLILNPPHTICGNTTIPKSFSLIMKVDGLKKLLENLSNEDFFRIEIFSERPVEYSFIKNE